MSVYLGNTEIFSEYTHKLLNNMLNDNILYIYL